MSHSPSSKPPVKQPGVHAPEVKEVLNTRAMYRTIIVVAVVFLLLACLAVLSSASMQQGETQSRPRAIVMLVPFLPPDMLEAAMASNKAPFLGLLSAADGIYARLRTKNPDLMASLVTILTGSENSNAVNLVNSTSFLRELKKRGKNPIVVAPSFYWSATKGGSEGNCSRVGILDSECSGVLCPSSNEEAYCNIAEKFLSCRSKAQLYQESTLDAFHHLMKHDGDLLYVHVNASSGIASTDEERLGILSDISVMDGTLGKLALAVIERSKTTSESWLIMLVGAGGNNLEKVPLVMAAYANGNLLRFGPIPEDATLADINPTLLNWYGVDSVNKERVRGMCSTGIVVDNCESTTNWP